MQLPPELQDSLSDRVIVDIEEWWASLTPEQRLEIDSTSEATPTDCVPLPNLDDFDPNDDHYQIYEYLVNHEIRTVGYVADEHKGNFHKIATTYLATLGSDYRHGDQGTVR